MAKPNNKKISIKKKLSGLSELFAEKFNTDFVIYEGYNSFDDIKKVINNKIDEMMIVQKGPRLLTNQFFRKYLINESI